ncbi:MAG: glycosyltransferase family 2 protein [Proteobacteria bacterium]|nr:glycosyltransferase family 2 protein [Pseudomonadota bacterium]MCL2307432.1 glycosyltransferase family 2 protein [Pseudomonadota bacterium]
MPSSDTTLHPLSLVLITQNAEAELAACLASAPFAAEIVIVDSGSTDNTRRIAEQFGARFIEQPWLGFGPQKNAAVTAARHDWVLCLDADERISDALAQTIATVFAQPESERAAAYALCRRNRFFDRWLSHGEGYPDWTVRLFDRRRARWSDDAVHEKVLIGNAGKTERLSGDLLHASAESLDTYLAKQNRYTTVQAERLFAVGVRTSAWQMFASPLARFFRFYFIKRGFLDGAAGFAHIAIGAFASFLKYAKLYALQKRATEDFPSLLAGEGAPKGRERGAKHCASSQERSSINQNPSNDHSAS